jgi:multicomponent Na+:H+ antiporter subunit D
MTLVEAFLQHSPALVIAIPLFTAFLLPLVSRFHGRVRNVFGLIMWGLTSCFVGLLAFDVLSYGPRVYIFGSQNLSVPLVRILFEVDGMGVFMAVITVMLAGIALIYSWSFLHLQDGLDKYYTLVFLVVASALGMELTGEAALKYIVISSIGALLVLFAIGFFYAQYDALNIATLAHLLQFTFLDKFAFVILIVSLGMKAGLAPMHMWLPDSYGRAPPSIVLVIMSATLASFYGVLRVMFTLYGNVLTTSLRFSLPAHVVIGWVLIALALVSILIGVIMALIQTDFLRLIGYAAVAEIGYMFLGVGASVTSLGSAYGTIALQGGLFHILNDAIDISLLFLVAGAIYYVTKKRSLDDISGLARTMKSTTIFFIIGLLAVAGMPPLNGFTSKFLIYESVFQVNPILSIIALLGSILLLAVFVKVLYAAFIGPEIPSLKNTGDAPTSMLLAMGALAVFAVVIGLFPNVFLDTFIKPAATALLEHAQYISMVVAGV